VEVVKRVAYKLARIMTGRPSRAASEAPATPVDPAMAFHRWAFAPDGPLSGLERLGREIHAEPIVSSVRNDARQEQAVHLLEQLDAGTNRLVDGTRQRKDILLSVLARCLPDTAGHLAQAMSYAQPCRGPSELWRDVLREHGNTRFADTMKELAAHLCPPLENALCKARDAYARRLALTDDQAHDRADADFAYTLGLMLLPFLAPDGQAAQRWTGMARVLVENGDVPSADPLSVGEQGDADDLRQAWKDILRKVTALEHGIKRMSQALGLSPDAREELEKQRDAALLASLNHCPSWRRLSQANAALNWMMLTDESHAETAPMLDPKADMEA
jgi:hypothetical protein